ADDPDGHEALSGPRLEGTIAAEVADRGRARRSRVADEVPAQSGAQRDGHEPQRRASVFEGAHADLLPVGQRAAQAGALLPGALAAAHAVHPAEDRAADGERV